jgi:translation elongation factor EF-Tu-like GTPase
MADRPNVTIQGIQEIQDWNIRAVEAMQPRGAVGRAVKYGTAAMHRGAVAVTHVITGSLRGSHRMEVSEERGIVYIDPGTVNPRTGAKPHEYGIVEHERGGSHAFYGIAVESQGEAVVREMTEIIERGLS